MTEQRSPSADSQEPQQVRGWIGQGFCQALRHGIAMAYTIFCFAAYKTPTHNRYEPLQQEVIDDASEPSVSASLMATASSGSSLKLRPVVQVSHISVCSFCPSNEGCWQLQGALLSAECQGGQAGQASDSQEGPQIPPSPSQTPERVFCRTAVLLCCHQQRPSSGCTDGVASACCFLL